MEGGMKDEGQEGKGRLVAEWEEGRGFSELRKK